MFVSGMFSAKCEFTRFNVDLFHNKAMFKSEDSIMKAEWLVVTASMETPHEVVTKRHIYMSMTTKLENTMTSKQGHNNKSDRFGNNHSLCW